MERPFTLYPLDDQCPCNSGMKASDCCFQEHPPLTREEVRFQSLNFEAELSNERGKAAPLPDDVSVEVIFNVPGQLEPQIEKIAEIARWKVQLPSGIDLPKAIDLYRPLSRRIVGLSDVIYSTRYHQLQFLFRLGRIVTQQSTSFTPPDSRHTIRVHDRPLRIELGSFLISTISSLDALAALLGIYLGISSRHNSYDKLRRHLVKNQQGKDKRAIRDMLSDAHDIWVSKARALRNKIVHEGSLGIANK